MSKQAELNYLRELTEGLQAENKDLCEALGITRNLAKALEKANGRLEEQIAILENQVHSSGKKVKIPKKPGLDWNQKMDFINKCVPDYQRSDPIKKLEKLFSVFCLARWKGAQEAYERKSKGKKQEPLPANVIAFPGGGGAQ